MTIKQIAETSNVSESTVRNWAKLASAKTAEVSAKIAKARETSVAADFTLPEVIAIVRAGGNETLANLLAENAVGPKKTKVITGLPNGKQLEALLVVYQPSDLRDRLDFLMGFHPKGKAEVPLTPLGLAVNPELSRLASEIKAAIPKDKKQLIAVLADQKSRAEARRVMDEMNSKLDFNGKRA